LSITISNDVLTAIAASSGEVVKVLIQRALVEHIPALKDYHDLVEFHIPHPYSKESSKKSNVVSIKYTCVALLITCEVSWQMAIVHPLLIKRAPITTYHRK
jgi:hypothetical protein